MTDLPLTIDGHDYSGLVDKYNYETTLTPVEGSRYTDLDKIEHVSIVRHRGGLTVKLNPISEDNAEALCADLMLTPVTVTYYSFQRNASVTETMEADETTMKDAFRHLSKKFAEGFTVTLTQL